MSDNEFINISALALFKAVIAGVPLFTLCLFLLFLDSDSGTDLHDAIVALVDSWGR